MPLRVSGRNMDLGGALRGRAAGQVDAVVRKYFGGGYDGHLTLGPEGFGYAARCTLHLSSSAVLRMSAFGADAVSAYEALVEAIAVRLRRYNDKLKQQRRLRGGEGLAPGPMAALPEDSQPEAAFAPPVVAEGAARLRQMSVGEAVMELDRMQSDVVVFRHAGHDGLNVVYRRADGNIGWIDPALRTN